MLMEFKVGKRLAQLREEMDMSQKELADLCGCSRVYISEIECDGVSPRLDILHTILTAVCSSLPRFFDSNVPDHYDHPRHTKLHQALQEALNMVEPTAPEVGMLEGAILNMRDGLKSRKRPAKKKKLALVAGGGTRTRPRRKLLGR